MFEGTRELDLFFAYGGTWRGNHIEHLREVNRKKGARIRVVLPDPDDSATVTELARRFGYDEPALIAKIHESVRTFEDLASEPGAKASIKVFLLARTPMYSFYRFDDVSLFAIYNHRGTRSTVPAFTVRRGGSLFAFFESDIGAIMDGKNASARLVFKKP